jgi:hypothetical protein
VKRREFLGVLASAVLAARPVAAKKIATTVPPVPSPAIPRAGLGNDLATRYRCIPPELWKLQGEYNALINAQIEAFRIIISPERHP